MIGDDDEEFVSLAQPRPRTFGVGYSVPAGARIGEVRINGKPTTQIANCVVDRELGLLTFGTFEDALRARAREKRAP